MRKSFTRLLGISLFSVLMLFSMLLKAQEVQSTVEVYAEDGIQACYNADNDYAVTISVKDLIKIKSFKLVLQYNKTLFTAGTATTTGAGSVLTGLTTTVSEAGTYGTVTLEWTNSDSVTIGDNVVTDIISVPFTIDGFPNNSGTDEFYSDLTWDAGNTMFYYDEGYSSPVSTINRYDGSATVTVQYTSMSEDDYMVQAASCAGSTVDVTILDPAEGTGFMYSYDNGTTWSTSASVSTTAPTTVSVRYKDASGCMSHEFIIDVPAPTPLVLSDVTSSDALCSGGNGSIIFDYSGGSAPYVFYAVPLSQVDDVLASIDNGDDKTPLAPYAYNNFHLYLPADSFRVVVDGNDCQDLFDYDGGWQLSSAWWADTIVIDDPDPIVLGDFMTVDNTCFDGTDGSIDIVGLGAVDGGQGEPYYASIDGINWVLVDTTAAGDVEFEGLAGTIDYTVQVKDSNGCTVSTIETINSPDPLYFEVDYQDVTCGATTGAIWIDSISGGSGSYEFIIDSLGVDPPDGPWTWTSTADSIENLPIGYYSIWVRDANDPTCIQPFLNQDLGGNELPIQAPGELVFTTNADDDTDVTCNGDDFTLTVMADGGFPSYMYSYNGGSYYSAESDTTYEGLTADTLVTVYVMDQEGCIISKDITIDVVPALSATYDSDDLIDPTCPGGTDGLTIIMASGGSGSYEYSVDMVTWDTNPYIAVAEGITTVYVRDAEDNDCMTWVDVDVPYLPINEISIAVPDTVDCYGEAQVVLDLTVEDWISGRVIDYVYASTEAAVYTDGTSFDPSTMQFAAGTYYIGAIDDYGCMAEVQEVTILQRPALTMTLASTDATCYGKEDGTLTITATGGSGIDNGDSTYFHSYAIANNPIAANNTSLTFTPFASYEIDTINGIPTPVSTQVISVQKGEYYVIVRDEYCVDDNSVKMHESVDGFDQILLDEENYPVEATDITCNDEDDGTFTVDAAGVSGGYPGFYGEGDYTYSLYDYAGGDTLVTSNTTGSFMNLYDGYFYVTITDELECEAYATDTLWIDRPDPLEIDLEDSEVTHFTCVNAHDGILTVEVDGGTGNYWMAVNASANGLGTDIKASDWLPFSGSDTKDYVATETGEYIVFVKDVNGCMAGPDTFMVYEPDPITLSIDSIKGVTCISDLDGYVEIDATGGWESEGFSPSFVYSIDDGDTWQGSPVFSGLAAGDYTVTVTSNWDNYGYLGEDYWEHYPALSCDYTLDFTIESPDPFVYQVTITDVACKGDASGALQVEVLDGGTPTMDGEYYVQLVTTANPDTLPGGWMMTEDQIALFDDLPAAHYDVWIKDGAGCVMPVAPDEEENAELIYSSVEGFEVNEPELELTAEVFWDQDVTCNGGSDGAFQVVAEGGSEGGYKYFAERSVLVEGHEFVLPADNSSDWQDSPNFTEATAGTWIIWVLDANGCIVGGEGDGTPVDEWRVTIEEPAPVTFTAELDSMVQCFGENAGVTAIDIYSEAGGPYTINVSGTDYDGNAVDVTVVGTESDPVPTVYVPATETWPDLTDPDNAYTVTLTDANGCSATGTIEVWQYPELTVSMVPAEGAFLCPGDVTGVMEAVVPEYSGNFDGDYEYRIWRDGELYTTTWQSIPSFLVQVGHTWEIEVRDDNGCIAYSGPYDLQEPVGVMADIAETTCYDDDAASVIVSASGEEGRTFYVRYRLNTESYTAWLPLDAETNELAIDGLMFANVEVTENFYYFQFMDDAGCMTEEMEYSFVPVQHPLEASYETSEDGLSADVTITGGTSPYSYVLDGGDEVALEDVDNFQVISLMVPASTVDIYDAHGCMISLEIPVPPITVTAVPADGEDMESPFDVVLTFNREVTVEEGDITGGTYTPGDYTELTVTVSGDDETTVDLVVGAVSDAAGNEFAGATFTYMIGDNTAPVADMYTPNDETISDNHPTLEIQFSEDVVLGSGNIYIYKVGTSLPKLTINVGTNGEVVDNVLTVTYDFDSEVGGLNKNTDYFVVYDAGIVTDAAGNEVAELSAETEWTFKTGADFATVNDPVNDSQEYIVYPNPFDTYVEVNNVDELSRIIITNVAGQRVKDIVEPSGVISTGDLRSGIYFITLIKDDVVVKTERIVKQ